MSPSGARRFFSFSSFQSRVLLFLAKEAEPLLAILLFAVLGPHGDGAGVARAGRDGRHGHGPAEAPRAAGRLAGARRDGGQDGADPGSHFSLNTQELLQYTDFKPIGNAAGPSSRPEPDT